MSSLQKPLPSAIRRRRQRFVSPRIRTNAGRRAADLVRELKLLVQHGNPPAATSNGASRRERLLWGAALAAAVIAGVGVVLDREHPEQPAKVSFEVGANVGG